MKNVTLVRKEDGHKKIVDIKEITHSDYVTPDGRRFSRDKWYMAVTILKG